MILILENWAGRMAEDFEAASASITLSALSALPPRGSADTPNARLWSALRAAAARGVLVRLYLAAPMRAHPATAQNGTTARALQEQGITCRLIPPPKLLHAKTSTIDERIVWIGSGNFTSAAAHHNHEAWCRFENHEIAARLAARWRTIAGG